MRPFEKYPVLAELLKPFRASQRLTLGLVIAALAEATSARSMEVATLLSSWLDVRLDSALNRFYRLLRNPRVDDLQLTRQMLRLLSRKVGKTLLLAIDWTEWREPLRMLVASVVTDRRAIPVHVSAFDKHRIARSQNARENTFLRTLSMVLKSAGLNAILLCDRGFRRVSWLALLQQHQLGFVVRLMDDVLVERRHGKRLAKRALSKLGLQRASYLGPVALREDGFTTVRVIGVWAPGAKEPWWLATSLDSSITHVVALYDRRFTIEEQFRDTKGCRFGLKLVWTQFRNPDHLSRFTLLLGVALLAWTVVGVAAANERPHLRFLHPTKGPRQSFVTIGMRALRAGTTGLRLTAAAVIRFLQKPRLRRFDWLKDALAPQVL